MVRLTAALLGLASSALVQGSAVSKVYDDVTTIDVNVKQLIATTMAFHGDAAGLTGITTGTLQVDLATRQGYYDSLALPQTLTTADASSLITHVNQTLSIDNPAAVATLKTKKKYFDALQASPVVAGGLQDLLNDHLAFSDEVLKRTPEPLLPQANEVVDVITNALLSGISYFSN